MNKQFKYTVVCFTDRDKRKFFISKDEAVDYANELLAAGEKCKIYPYQPKRYVDRLAEEGPPPGLKVDR